MAKLTLPNKTPAAPATEVDKVTGVAPAPATGASPAAPVSRTPRPYAGILSGKDEFSRSLSEAGQE